MTNTTCKAVRKKATNPLIEQYITLFSSNLLTQENDQANTSYAKHTVKDANLLTLIFNLFTANKFLTSNVYNSRKT